MLATNWLQQFEDALRKQQRRTAPVAATALAQPMLQAEGGTNIAGFDPQDPFGNPAITSLPEFDLGTLTPEQLAAYLRAQKLVGQGVSTMEKGAFVGQARDYAAQQALQDPLVAPLTQPNPQAGALTGQDLLQRSLTPGGTIDPNSPFLRGGSALGPFAPLVKPVGGPVGDVLQAAQQKAGGIGEDLLRRMNQRGQTFNPGGVFDPIRLSNEEAGSVGRFLGEVTVPTTPLDIALTAALFAGKVPGAARAGQKALSESAMAASAGKVARRLATEEAGFAKLGKGSEDEIRKASEAFGAAFKPPESVISRPSWEQMRADLLADDATRQLPKRNTQKLAEQWDDLQVRLGNAPPTPESDIRNAARAAYRAEQGLFENPDLAAANAAARRAAAEQGEAERFSRLMRAETRVDNLPEGAMVRTPAGEVEAASGLPPSPSAPPPGASPPSPPVSSVPPSGRDPVHNFIEALSPRRLGDELRQAVAGLDVSNMFRQGIFTIRHGTENVRGWASGLRGIKNEQYAIARNAELQAGDRPGLFLSDLPSHKGSVVTKEENFAGDFFGNMPGWKQTGRGNILGLNEVRAGSYDTVRNMWHRTAERVAAGESGPVGRVTNWLAHPGDEEALGRYISRATGRGTLGPAEGTWLSDALGIGIFSPRFQISRPQALANLFNYQNPRVAIEAWKDFGAFFGATTSLLALADASGLAKVNLDPNSADFGQFRIGHTRIDPWAGLRPMANLAARLYSGHYASGADASVEELLTGFGRSKLAPLPADVLNAALGEDQLGRDFSWEEIATSVAPITFQGLYQAAKEGLLGEALRAFPAELVGFGTQTYRSSADLDDFSQKRFGKDYNSLSAVRQAQVHAEMIASGERLNSKQRVGPWWQARDDAIEAVGKGNPVIAKFEDYEDWRNYWYDQFEKKGIPEADWAGELQKVNKRMGIDDALRRLRIMAAKQDPDIVKAMEDQKISVPDYITEALR